MSINKKIFYDNTMHSYKNNQKIEETLNSKSPNYYLFLSF